MRSHLQVLGRCNNMLCLSCWAKHTFLVMLLARGAERGDSDKQTMHCSAPGHCCRAALHALKAECLSLIVTRVWCGCRRMLVGCARRKQSGCAAAAPRATSSRWT